MFIIGDLGPKSVDSGFSNLVIYSYSTLYISQQVIA